MDIFAESKTEILTTFFLSALDSSAALWYLRDRNNTDLCWLQTKMTFFFQTLAIVLSKFVWVFWSVH